MSTEAALDRLDTAERGLRGAMEASDADAILLHTRQFTEALEAVQALGAVRADPAARERVRQLMARLESDRIFARLITGMIDEKLSCAGSRPDAPAGVPLTYGRR